eukprot:TRINITY_DN31564_c0_g1_i1.p1 TRINITY_DN31564_c0_g1~~TRINITY_DN31564_c0_g1_i1.p1  ORF type:complete len:379 (-),score=75.33 TRINITY_DN31564_c0_g1_i1:120-1256(-)
MSHVVAGANIEVRQRISYIIRDCTFDLPVGLRGLVEFLDDAGDAKVTWSDPSKPRWLLAHCFAKTALAPVSAAIVAGATVMVRQPITYLSEAMKYKLRVGLKGDVVSLDENGDAQVKWEPNEFPRWLLKSMFGRVHALTEQDLEESAVLVGAEVELTRELLYRAAGSGPVLVLPGGLRGIVQSFDQNGDAKMLWERSDLPRWLLKKNFDAVWRCSDTWGSVGIDRGAVLVLQADGMEYRLQVFNRTLGKPVSTTMPAGMTHQCQYLQGGCGATWICLDAALGVVKNWQNSGCDVPYTFEELIQYSLDGCRVQAAVLCRLDRKVETSQSVKVRYLQGRQGRAWLSVDWLNMALREEGGDADLPFSSAYSTGDIGHVLRI